jgi:hypothetical protein
VHDLVGLHKYSCVDFPKPQELCQCSKYGFRSAGPSFLHSTAMNAIRQTVTLFRLGAEMVYIKNGFKSPVEVVLWSMVAKLKAHE